MAERHFRMVLLQEVTLETKLFLPYSSAIKWLQGLFMISSTWVDCGKKRGLVVRT